MKFLFNVEGYDKIGLGHIYRVIALGNVLKPDHELLYVCHSKSELGIKVLSQHGFVVKIINSLENLSKILKDFNPDIVINDKLDTTKQYMTIFKDKQVFTVNFEDLGEGSKMSNMTINALYEKKNDYHNSYWGKNYYILREEFQKYKKKGIIPGVRNILVTFGGTDPNNYTRKVINILNDIKPYSCRITVILGLGYLKMNKLVQEINKMDLNIDVKRNVKDISKYMYESDIAFTSAGRTVYELASMGIPTIVLAQNQRELLHTFASEENGVINVGLGYLIPNDDLKTLIERVIKDFNFRKECSDLMLKNNLKSGINNVINLIFDQYKIYTRKSK